jgi:twitching motility protein PilT
MDIADLDRLLQTLEELDGSDLHIKAGAPPRVRVAGALRTLEGEPTFTADDTQRIAEAMMTETVRETFRTKHEADYAYSVPGTGRFRVNAYYQRSSAALAIRRVRASPATAQELGLPPVVTQLAQEMRGLVLVTGPTGSGKTTSLAAMIDHINHLRACHIVTIEDPVEVLHKDDLAAIDQREVGFDTDSFSSAMRVVLRQDPDVILVGEMRDQETVAAALSAAETQIRISLAGSLKGIVCQRLIPTADGESRVPALEVLVINGRIQQAIVDPLLTGDIDGIVAEGAYYGMVTFDQSLAALLSTGRITLAEAMTTATNPHDLKVMLERQGILQTGSFATQLG